MSYGIVLFNAIHYDVCNPLPFCLVWINISGMGGLEFEDKLTTIDNLRSVDYQQEQQPKMIKLLIRSGLVKDKKQANYLMLAIVVAFLLLSVYLFSLTVGSTPKIVPYNQLTEQQKQKISPQERAFIERVTNNNHEN